MQLYRHAAARMAHAWAWLHALPQRLHVLQQRLRSRLGQTNLEMLLQPSGPRLGTELEWRHSAQSRSKLALRVGLAAFSVTLSTERRLSRTSASAIGAALQWSQRGLLLKLRISRHSHRLVVPLYLAATPSPADLLLGCGVPSRLLAVAHDGEQTYNPPPQFILRAGMTLIALGERDQLERLARYARGERA